MKVLTTLKPNLDLECLNHCLVFAFAWTSRKEATDALCQEEIKT